MTARTRLWVLVVSTPVIAFTLIGGYLGQAATRDETLRNLRVFEDVMLVAGDREAAEGTVSVRSRSGGDLGARAVSAFIADAQGEIARKGAS